MNYMWRVTFFVTFLTLAVAGAFIGRTLFVGVIAWYLR